MIGSYSLMHWLVLFVVAVFWVATAIAVTRFTKGRR